MIRTLLIVAALFTTSAATASEQRDVVNAGAHVERREEHHLRIGERFAARIVGLDARHVV